MNPDWSEYAKRNQLLQARGYPTYQDYLNSSLWRSIKKRVLIRSPQCEVCRAKTQVVHHIRYTFDVLFRGDARGLIALCHRCHTGIEVNSRGVKENPADVTSKLLHLLTLAGNHARASQVAEVVSGGSSMEGVPQVVPYGKQVHPGEMEYRKLISRAKAKARSKAKARLKKKGKTG